MNKAGYDTVWTVGSNMFPDFRENENSGIDDGVEIESSLLSILTHVL